MSVGVNQGAASADMNSVATFGRGIHARPRQRLRLEHVVMGGAVLALVILVVLPLGSLLLGSVRGEEGLSLDHFKRSAVGAASMSRR